MSYQPARMASERKRSMVCTTSRSSNLGGCTSKGKKLEMFASIANLLLLILVFACPCAAITADGKALLAFLQSLKGNRDALKDWNSSDVSPCGWTGIACSSVGRVVNISLSQVDLQGSIPPQFAALSALQYLSLPSTNLTGSIPRELGGCSELEVIDISSNNLSGSIPPELGQLKKLEQLSLESNQLDGSIPPELGNCSSLQSLTLHDNQLSGSIPGELGGLESLELFRAGGNPLLSGSIPPELAKCSKLVVLGLAATSVSGVIPPALGELTNLKILSLYQTNLTGSIPPELGNCSQLDSLYLYDNHLSGVIPRELGKLQQLSTLLLWQNNLSGSIPAELGHLRNLQQLDLSQNSLTGSIPETFGNLSLLVQLYLSVNVLSGSIPSVLSNCSNLSDLQLDRNNLSGAIPEQLGRLTRLSQIFLWNNSLEGPVPSTLGNCSVLQSLDFSWNQLTGSVPTELFQLQMLQKFLLLSNNLSGKVPGAIGLCGSLVRLRLGNNSLTGPLPKEIGQLQHLSFIDISDNYFTGPLPAQIANCNALQLFDIHGNQLSGTIPGELSRLTNLQVLDASRNHFTGPIPAELGGLGLLNKLSLQSNSLSGSIPKELARCVKLESLDLSDNSLTGTIPASLGEIEALTILLNLSWNNLFGSIPEQLSRLSNLGALDLSHNRFSGSLDSIGQLGNLVTLNISFNEFSGALPDTYFFRTLPENDFVGNPGLCIPSSSKVSCFTSDARNAKVEGADFPKAKLIVGFLFGGAAVMVAIGLFIVYNMRKTPHIPVSDQEYPRPWQLKAFQKLSFSIEDILDRLDDANIIGKGCSGVVYRAEMPSGEVIAVKKLFYSSASKGGPGPPQRDVFAAEVATLGTIRHLNIVRLLGYCSNHETKLLMYDYMPNGSLGEMLHEKRRALDWETRYKIVVGAAQGLAYLHHDCVPPILHRDVKANNILLGPRYEPHLADFGLAKIVDSPGATQTVLAGSYGYIAPEYGYTLNITDKSDVYSYGVVLLEVLTGRRPVEASLGEGRHLSEWVREMQCSHHDAVEILDPKLQGMPDPYIHEMLQALWIALDCVHPVPEERPTMRHVAALLVGIKHEVEEYAKIDVLLEKAAMAARRSCSASPTRDDDDNSKYLLGDAHQARALASKFSLHSSPPHHLLHP